MNKIWVISDTHFGHSKMTEYCGRPECFEQLIWLGLQQIDEGDLLIHLGDIWIGSDAKWHAMFIQTLPCAKVLVLGNHDKKSNVWYRKHGWDLVMRTFSLGWRGKSCLFSHEPKNLLDYDLNIFGHFHNNLPRLLRKEWVTPTEEKRNGEALKMLTPKHKLFALEFTDYKPMQLEDLFN
jgi:calcineurin-like phosphoesterase family protein